MTVSELRGADSLANNWSKQEVRLIVRDYLAMLALELSDAPYVKSAHRHDLRKLLTNRSDGSVERKHQNISAIMHELGYPSIDGYKPLKNYQAILADVVREEIAAAPRLIRLVEDDVGRVPDTPSVADILSALEEPPDDYSHAVAGAVSERAVSFQPTAYGYLQREAQNQRLGEAGEQFVMNFEKARLIRAGRDSLAEKIEQVSTTIGDSAGYDIRSYEPSGVDRFIEAKTTKYGKETPFYVCCIELHDHDGHTQEPARPGQRCLTAPQATIFVSSTPYRIAFSREAMLMSASFLNLMQ